MSCLIKRPTWDDYFKQMAELTALRSPSNKLQVGCVFVKEKRVIACGYNGYLRGCSHCSVIRDGHEISTIHAEQNAIADCAKRGVSCDGSTAYVTHYPCLNCAKIMFSSGVSEVKYINDYNNDELVKDYAVELDIKIEKI